MVVKYKFMMSLCGEVNRQSHEDYFNRHNIDWDKAVWVLSNVSSWDKEVATFKSLDGKCEACTKIKYFVPCREEEVDLEDYM